MVVGVVVIASAMQPPEIGWKSTLYVRIRPSPSVTDRGARQLTSGGPGGRGSRRAEGRGHKETRLGRNLALPNNLTRSGPPFAFPQFGQQNAKETNMRKYVIASFIIASMAAV